MQSETSSDRQTYHSVFRWLIFSPEWMLSQVLKAALRRVYSYPNLTFNLPNIVNICQRRITSSNHSIEVNILWFQLVYDIEHLYSQSAPVFDLNKLSTVASGVENKYSTLS